MSVEAEMFSRTDSKSLGGRDMESGEEPVQKSFSVGGTEKIDGGKRDRPIDLELVEAMNAMAQEMRELRAEVNDMKQEREEHINIRSNKRKRKENETFSREDVERHNEDFYLEIGKRPKIGGEKEGRRSNETGEKRAKPKLIPNVDDDEHDDAVSLHADEEDYEFLLDGVDNNNIDDGEDEDEGDDILATLEKEIEERNKKGPKINEKLAKVIASRFTTRLKDDSMKNKVEKYGLPENCDVIAAPTLNEELLQAHVGLKRSARRDDARLASVQKHIARSVAALAAGAEKLHAFAAAVASKEIELKANEVKKVANEVLANSLDACAFLGNAQQDLTLRRKFQLFKDLPVDIRSICYSKCQREESEKLFGEDLSKKMKEAREEYRLQQRQKSGNQYGKKPYYSNAFLGGRGRGFFQPSTNHQQQRYFGGSHFGNKKRGGSSGQYKK